jgi:hypothetical protein
MRQQMFASFKRGWAIGKASWAVLKEQPSLLVFPVVAAVSAVVLTGIVAVPVLLGTGAAIGLMDLSDRGMQAVALVGLFVCYFVGTFAVVFCNAALIACALQRFAGGQATIGSGFSAARRRLPQILGWSLLAATVGAAVQALTAVFRDKFGTAANTAGDIGLGVWGIASYFVLPVIVTEGTGPIESVKRSASILRRNWGESLGSAGFGVIVALFMLPLLALGGLALAASGSGTPLAAVLGSVFVVYLLAWLVLATALNSIFRAGVYSYATTGNAPGHMDVDVLESAFRKV